MEQKELICLIEDAEQGGDLQTVDNGKAARVELDNMNKQLAELREEGEKMAERIRMLKTYQNFCRTFPDSLNIEKIFTEEDAAALAKWEAAWKKAHTKVIPHKPCCRCKRTEPAVTFAKKSIRCTDCNNEAQRISRVRTGKRPPTMIG